MTFALCTHNLSYSGQAMTASLFTAGLLGGFTHCAGMCGPFVLSQIQNNDNPSADARMPVLGRLRQGALLPYHFGRMTTYVALAVLFHLFFNIMPSDSVLRDGLSAVLLFSAAMIFLGAAFPQMALVFPWLARARLPVPTFWIGWAAAFLSVRPQYWRRYLLGVALGFLPCGLVVAAILAAAVNATALNTALAMAAFSLGTIPALVLVGTGGGALYNRWPRGGRWVRRVAMVFSSFTLLGMAGKIIFSI